MSSTSVRTSVLRIDDLIVAEGPVGDERILVPGFNVTVPAGEAVAVIGGRDGTAAFLDACTGRRRPQYGTIRVGSRPVGGGGRRAARDPLTVVAGSVRAVPNAEAVVVDARRASAPGDPGRLRALVRDLAERGTAVLVVADDAAAVQGVADRELPLDRAERRPADHQPTAPEPLRFKRSELLAGVADALTAAGVTPDRARLVARVLVDADARGHFSHGVGLLPMYLDRLARGGIRADAEVEWISAGGPVSVLAAHGGFGQVAAELAAATCARTAKESGVATVAVRGNNHIGMLAAYRHHFVEHGVIGLIFNISGPGVAAPGAARATLGNDAVCMIVPRGHDEPFVVDFATGRVASGKIRHAAQRGTTVPDSWLVDREGRPTTDPEELDRGGAVPVFGGHKGLGVALITEVLGGILGGGTISPRVHKQRAEPERAMDCAQLFIALDPAAFGDPPVDDLVNALHTAVASGYAAEPPLVHFPEQQERIAERRAEESGIPVPHSVAAALGWTAASPAGEGGGHSIDHRLQPAAAGKG
ncbi:Ldh family oxidoreductase [Streptomyces sp. NPDC059629]|uniref:Ldh family oxidoreductase n=1 Tax=Streptomyces sp. NPDC059629 TaxID=3346889 RepID=UPI0036C807E9